MIMNLIPAGKADHGNRSDLFSQFELVSYEPVVCSLKGYEPGMRPRFGHPSPFKHHNIVCMTHGTEPVSHDDHCAPGIETCEVFNYHFFV